MRARNFTLLAIVLALIMATPGVAMADEPVVTTSTLVLEGQPNPCDPSETQQVTIVFTIKTHNHNNNVVRIIETELTTDDGNIGKGHQHDVIVNGIRRTTTKFISEDPETGERFSITIRFWLDLETGEIIKGSVVPVFDCIKAAA